MSLICYDIHIFSKVFAVKIKQDVSSNENKEDSLLEIFLKNLNPDVVCDLKDCSIDPFALQIGNFLGRGIYFIIPKSML